MIQKYASHFDSVSQTLCSLSFFPAIITVFPWNLFVDIQFWLLFIYLFYFNFLEKYRAARLFRRKIIVLSV